MNPCFTPRAETQRGAERTYDPGVITSAIGLSRVYWETSSVVSSGPRTVCLLVTAALTQSEMLLRPEQRAHVARVSRAHLLEMFQFAVFKAPTKSSSVQGFPKGLDN